MTESDKQLKEKLDMNLRQMPDSLEKTFDETIEQLRSSEAEPRQKQIHIFRYLQCAVLASLAVVIILPNICRESTLAMQEVPASGRFIAVYTADKYSTQNNLQSISASVPHIISEGYDHPDTKKINDEINGLIDRAAKQFEKAKSNFSDSPKELNIDYDIITNNADWISLRIEILQTCADSDTEYYFCNIRKTDASCIQLSDLFFDEFDYVKVFSNSIRQQMEQQMNSDDYVIYWIDDNSTAECFTEIDTDQKFYFDDEGNIVIVFNKYEIAPGYMGCPEFTLSSDIFSDFIIE